MSERIWEYQSGFLAKGNDLVNAQKMTLEEAEEWCQGHPEAIGFSYQSAEQSPEAAVSVFIKSDECNTTIHPGVGWHTLLWLPPLQDPWDCLLYTSPSPRDA